VTAFTARARTARGYMAEFSLTGAVIAATVAVGLMLAVLATFSVWPAISSQRTGGPELGSGLPMSNPATSPPNAAVPTPVGGAFGSPHPGRSQSGAPDRDSRGSIEQGGGVRGGNGGSDGADDVTGGGGDASAPSGTGSTSETGSASTPGSSGKGLKLGHSKTSNGNGQKVGHGTTGAAEGTGADETFVPPGQAKKQKKG